MTLDGKIATQAGHSAWVTSPQARALVFEQRARSDAVIVGGNTVRRDNPRLTTRREGGHAPVRVVMSRTLDLPADADLWDVTVAPTIVMTQRGAKKSIQALLRSRGVEVVEFDFLTPDGVADYCFDRGFLQVRGAVRSVAHIQLIELLSFCPAHAPTTPLQCFWECGGVLSAPCISGNVIHKVMAFVAPKIIGGTRAPTPVGELGFVEMTQAVDVVGMEWRQVGPDLVTFGYLPNSGGPENLHALLCGSRSNSGGADPVEEAKTASTSSRSEEPQPVAEPRQQQQQSVGSASVSKRAGKSEASFYKAWDLWGAFGNFSPHPITMPAPVDPGGASSSSTRVYDSVEHYYQASKFSRATEEGRELADRIAGMPSPEEAARLGRLMQRKRPDLLRPGWDEPEVRAGAMMPALRAKFTQHAGPRAMLLSSAGLALVEASPHDFFWGRGHDGTGRNQLGRLLQQVREEMLLDHDGR